jgi:ABC-type molybdate transport system substrate-binding protein
MLYPVVTISSSKHESGAQALVAYVLSASGQKALSAAGFEPLT